MRTGVEHVCDGGRNFGRVVTIEYERFPGPFPSKGYSGLIISNGLYDGSVCLPWMTLCSRLCPRLLFADRLA